MYGKLKSSDERSPPEIRNEEEPTFSRTKPEKVGHPGKNQSQNRLTALRLCHPPGARYELSRDLSGEELQKISRQIAADLSALVNANRLTLAQYHRVSCPRFSHSTSLLLDRKILQLTKG